MGIKAMGFKLALKFVRSEIEAHTKGKTDDEVSDWVRKLARSGIDEIPSPMIAKWIRSVTTKLDEKIDKE